MVFVYVPRKDRKRKASPRERAISFFIAAMLAIGFAILVVMLGPKHGPKPPAYVLWVLVGVAVALCFVAFFSWLNHGNDSSDESLDNNPNEEQ
jgi:quinol-cytochrome oxidoreductase complex cytochrome b subunit